MSLTTLPNELLLSIAPYLPLPCLSSLCRTTHHLNTLLSPLLPSHITTIKDADRIFQWAVAHNRPDLLTRTISVGINPIYFWIDSNDPLGPGRYLTALDRVSVTGFSSLARILISYEPTSPRVDSWRTTSLHIAAANGHADIVAMMLDVWTNVDLWSEQYYQHRTPLYLACEGGHEVVVELLLDKGANMELEIDEGEKALYVAAENGRVEVVKMLLQRGAEVGDALHVAAEAGQMEVVEMLVERGADLERLDLRLMDREGRTAIQVAEMAGRDDIVEVLRRAVEAQGLRVDSV